MKYDSGWVSPEHLLLPRNPGIELKFPGNNVYYTISLILIANNMLCSRFHRPKVLIQFHSHIRPTPGCRMPLHPEPYTPHPTPHTLHPTPYALHLTPYTLHPTPSPITPNPEGVSKLGPRRRRAAISYEKAFILEISGSEIYHTACS